MRGCEADRGRTILFLLVGQIALCALAIPAAFGQGATTASPADIATRPAGSALAFDVVSIRQDKSGAAPQPGVPPFGPTADGWYMTNVPLAVAIQSAYVPQTGAYYVIGQIKGMPDWAVGNADRYDIVAKVSDADLADWHKPAAQAAMLHAMLQAMLADRCKLATHRELKEVPVYALVVGKGGPKFKETDPTATHPAGRTMPGGGTLVHEDGDKVLHFYAVPMTLLATILSNYAGHPVEDKTGLKGEYDFALQNPAAVGGDDPGPAMEAVDALGLRLDATKGTVETLVIDHVEKPSPN